MRHFIVLPTTILAIASVESFAPIQKLLNAQMQNFHEEYQNSLLCLSSEPQDQPAATSDPPASPDASKTVPSVSSITKTEDASPVDDMKSKIMSVFDNADQILANALSGDFGKRGEVYVITQAFLVLCILFGGLPVLGDWLNILCGPVLMAVGAGAVALGIVDMGASLSPWPVPTGDDLVTDGIYSKVRHPIYAGLLAIMAGFSVLTGSAPRLLLTAALWYALDLKSDFEEKQLIKEYSEYEAYQEEVPGKFFPEEIIAILPWTASDDDIPILPGSDSDDGGSGNFQ